MIIRAILNRRVEVYYNLHKNCWTVRSLERWDYGKVIAYVSAISLKNCKFVVQPAGNRRVRETGRKNVHAFVRGIVIGLNSPARSADLEPFNQVVYNPYKNTTFVLKWNSKPVHEARRVTLLSDRTVFRRN
jgi:hypothetical protein